MKRPSQEDFDKIVKDYKEKRDAVKALADTFNCTLQTSYVWYEQMQNKITSNKAEVMRKSFYDMLNKNTIEPLREYSVNIPSSVMVVCLSDLHIGSKYSDGNLIEKHIKMIKENPNVYAIIVGDIIDRGLESTTPDSLKHEQILSFKEQKEAATLLYEEIGHKILATTTGCHGNWYYKESGEYLEEELANNSLTKIFLENGGLLHLNVGKIPYTIFMSHKLHGGSFLNPTRGIMRINEVNLDFDIGIMAHKHSANITSEYRRQKQVIAITCGSYKNLDGFANKEGLIAQPLSIPGFYLDNTIRKIIPYINWEDYFASLHH